MVYIKFWSRWIAKVIRLNPPCTIFEKWFRRLLLPAMLLGQFPFTTFVTWKQLATWPSCPVSLLKLLHKFPFASVPWVFLHLSYCFTVSNSFFPPSFPYTSREPHPCCFPSICLFVFLYADFFSLSLLLVTSLTSSPWSEYSCVLLFLTTLSTI